MVISYLHDGDQKHLPKANRKKKPQFSYEVVRQITRLIASTPLRLVAIYFLGNGGHNNNKSIGGGGVGGSFGGGGGGGSNGRLGEWQNAIDLMTYLIGKILRMRTRVITGK